MPMDVYFEKLTLPNLGVGFLYLIRGRQVYYFEAGRLFGRFPGLFNLLLRRFRRAEYQLSDPMGLNYEVHGTSLEAAEDLHDQLIHRNAMAVGLWRSMFRSERVHLYIKKMVAMEAWCLIRDYLVILYRVREENRPAQLVVLDSALNRLVIPVLLGRYSDSRVEVRGLSRFPWRYFQNTTSEIFTAVEQFARLLWMIKRRGFVIRANPRSYKVSKEIIWGIGIGTGRRSDDFIVDGRLILAPDILLYYRRGSAPRMGRPEFLQTSIANATAKGYHCADFDRVPIVLSRLWPAFVPRYVLLPTLLLLHSLVRQIGNPTAGLLSNIVMAFLIQARDWDIFLASYSPLVNLSQDDSQASHIADTIALNLHGFKNSGFQWSDMTCYRAVNQAYLGYNLYFAWGPLPEKYWKGNWGVDRVVHTGYLWGHHYQESMEQGSELRKSLLGADHMNHFVVSLFDEKPDRETHQSEDMLYEFYRVGIELLEKRPDTIVYAKPKRFDGIPEVAKVQKLIAPYVDCGRLKFCDINTVDLWHVLAISDVAISMVLGTPHLEAVCCRRIGFSYAPTRNYSSPVYSRGYGKVVFDGVAELVEAVDRVLDHPDENPWDGLEDLVTELDPYRDQKGTERMRSFICEMSDATYSYQQPEPASLPGTH